MEGRAGEELMDREIALIGVLEELTVAALDLFDPDHSLTPFLQRIAERFGSRVALCVERPDATASLRLMGSAGLSRISRALAFPSLTDGAALETAAFPYLEASEPLLTRWVMSVRGDRLDGKDVSWWIVLIFEGEPRLPHRYRRILDRLGKTMGVALTHRHLSRLLRERDTELRAFNNRLEQGVAARTRELAAANQELERRYQQLSDVQEQLIHVGKMAAVGTLVAGLSHELNNPLSIILGYVQSLLRHPAEPAPARRALLAIERQAQRCGSLLRSLRSLSRTTPAGRERTAVATVLHSVRELSFARLKQQRVQLHLDYPDHGLPDIVADPQEIESALLILVFNALDVSPQESSIELKVLPLAHDGVAGVGLSVCDHGQGISAGVLPHIFEPFFTTKPVDRGSGLGLSLARQIIESHGGSIRVETLEGKGTNMHLWLPVADVAPPNREDRLRSTREARI